MIDVEQIRETVAAHREEIVNCLVELVQTPSVTGDEVAVSQVVPPPDGGNGTGSTDGGGTAGAPEPAGGMVWNGKRTPLYF